MNTQYMPPLFDLASSGVYHAGSCYQSRGALLPHLFTLTRSLDGRAVYFLGHFPSTDLQRPAGRYPALCVHEARTFLSITGAAIRLSGKYKYGIITRHYQVRATKPTWMPTKFHRADWPGNNAGRRLASNHERSHPDYIL